MGTRQHYDFEKLAKTLLHFSNVLLPELLPGGRMQGHNYVCSSIQGGKGGSFVVNTLEGYWNDFNSSHKGGDLISLYAAVHNLEQGEAYRRLNERFGSPDLEVDKIERPLPARRKDASSIQKPPRGTKPPTFLHPKLGRATAHWAYTDSNSDVLFYVARYETGNGKTFLPYTWCSQTKSWQTKGFPAPRPLYGLDRLASYPEKPVMIVEGEKAADAATKLVGQAYVVVTWPNGSEAYRNSTWAPVYGRDVVIWPDSDESGIKAAEGLGSILKPHVKRVRILKVECNGGWDAADAVMEGWSYQDFLIWARKRIETLKTTDPVPRETKTATEVVTPDSKPPTATIKIDDGMPALPANVYAFFEEVGVQMTANGEKPIQNAANASRIISYLFGKHLWFDEFRKRFYSTFSFMRMKPSKEFELDFTNDAIHLMIFFQSRLNFFQITDSKVLQGLIDVCMKNKKNEAQEYLQSCQWDQTERLPYFFRDYAGALDNEYTRAVSQNFWISMAARIMNPGCKVDNMVVLEGDQGVRKAQFLEAIVTPRWYTIAPTAYTDKSFGEALEGKLLMEMAELAALTQKTSNEVKSKLTQRVDRYRPSYGRSAQDYPRQGIIVGTTNDDEYLEDPTGNRRYWPIKTNGILKHKEVASLRDQFFAEAVHKYQQGKTWWEVPHREASSEQEARRQTSVWEELVADGLSDQSETTMKFIALEILKIDKDRLDARVEKRIIKTLRSIGWRKGPRKRINGKPVNPWYSPEAYELISSSTDFDI